jgi:hypothetical protein
LAEGQLLAAAATWTHSMDEEEKTSRRLSDEIQVLDQQLMVLLDDEIKPFLTKSPENKVIVQEILKKYPATAYKFDKVHELRNFFKDC